MTPAKITISSLNVLRARSGFGKEALEDTRALFLVTLRARLQESLANLRDASPFVRSNRF